MKCIAIVEDEDFMREELCDILRKAGEKHDNYHKIGNILKQKKLQILKMSQISFCGSPPT